MGIGILNGGGSADQSQDDSQGPDAAYKHRKDENTFGGDTECGGDAHAQSDGRKCRYFLEYQMHNVDMGFHYRQADGAGEKQAGINNRYRYSPLHQRRAKGMLHKGKMFCTPYGHKGRFQYYGQSVGFDTPSG